MAFGGRKRREFVIMFLYYFGSMYYRSFQLKTDLSHDNELHELGRSIPNLIFVPFVLIRVIRT